LKNRRGLKEIRVTLLKKQQN